MGGRWGCVLVVLAWAAWLSCGACDLFGLAMHATSLAALVVCLAKLPIFYLAVFMTGQLCFGARRGCALVILGCAICAWAQGCRCAFVVLGSAIVHEPMVGLCACGPWVG
eukprot:1160859-Pelagomonas_calceolata.AAC.2